jgi:arylsulfatase A-like enzyme
MNRNFIKSLAILTAGIETISCSSTTQKEVKHPNIIYIMSDDHAYQAISAYGEPLAKVAPTPNIDRIANNGMRFNRCYVTNSLSGPARATILTGEYSHINGFKDNFGGSRFDSSLITFPKVLQKAGYQTAIIGKWHLGSDPTGFDYWDILPGQGVYYNPEFINSTGHYPTSGYVTEIITEKALKWLDQAKKSGKPFMLMMHHKAPHHNWQPGPNELGMYDNVVFPEPATLFDNYANRGPAEHNQNMTIANTMRLDMDLKLTSRPQRGLDSAQQKLWDAEYRPKLEEFNKLNITGTALTQYKYQRFLEDYLACVAAVDKSVGDVLDYLKKNGLDKNTIVVYTSDQGFYLGEHGWFDKRWMFNESLRTPLLIEWPGVIKPGSVNNDMVSSLDFAETFIDAAGADIPQQMQGQSFLPILKGQKQANPRTEHYYHYYEAPSEHYVPRHYGITTDRYKLIHFYYNMQNNINEWELFDLEKDPNELVNVYNNPEYSSVRDSMHIELKKLMAKYKDSDSLAMKFVQETIDHPPFMYWLIPQDSLMKMYMPNHNGNRTEKSMDHTGKNTSKVLTH